MLDDPHFMHDFKNYIYAQKAMTEMCLTLAQSKNWEQLEKSLQLLNRQQEMELSDLVERLKKIFLANEQCSD